jgi:site-specific recombinase XerC
MNNDEIEYVKSRSSGATLTKVAREAALRQFRDVCHLELNLQVKGFKALSASHIKKVIDHLKKGGRSDRTLQNLMSHIRAALRVFGRSEYADSAEMSNQVMGISGASRQGTHVALDDGKYLATVAELSPTRPGSAACLKLQSTLGLRMAESIMANQSVESWLNEIRLYKTVTVIHGTKGGRSRIVNLRHPDLYGPAEDAIQNAIRVTREDKEGSLIPSASLLGARKMYSRNLRAARLWGKEASHSARYAWALKRFQAYLDEGCEAKEAKSRLSMDLGHGDGRLDIINNVYLLSLKDQI